MARRNFYDETLNEEFREGCILWAEGLRVTPNALFMFAAQFGKGKSWIKERYYGGIKAKRSDIAWVQLHTIGAENIISALHEGNQMEAENKYKLAVSNMCRACTRTEKTPGCPDSSCPLRPVSPLALRGA